MLGYVGIELEVSIDDGNGYDCYEATFPVVALRLVGCEERWRCYD